jgi:hypothetical protein
VALTLDSELSKTWVALGARNTARAFRSTRYDRQWAGLWESV